MTFMCESVLAAHLSLLGTTSRSLYQSDRSDLTGYGVWHTLHVSPLHAGCVDTGYDGAIDFTAMAKPEETNQTGSERRG